MRLNYDYPTVLFHVDVDSDRTLGKFYGGREAATNLVYERGIPKILKFFGEFKVKATFFINGSDLKKKHNLRMAQKVYNNGHELASHSYWHHFGFTSWEEENKRRDMELNLRILNQVTGRKNFGFRAPGYDIDEKTIRLVTEVGHLYDSSLYPSLLNPLLKWYLTKWKGVKVPPGYGELKNIWRPDFPHKWFSGYNSFIWEIPVSVFRGIRLPLSSLFVSVAPESYLRLGLRLFKKRHQPLVFLFHAVEFVDADWPAVPMGLASHPSFKLDWRERRKRLDSCMTMILRDFRCRRTDDFVIRGLR